MAEDTLEHWWIAGRDHDEVAIVRWPGESRRRDELAAQGRARLLIVAAGELPPAPRDRLEDWVRAGCDAVETFARKENLRIRQAERTPAVLDDDGILHRGARWVALSRREAQVARALIDRTDRLVGRGELLTAAWPEAEVDDRRMLDSLVRRLNRRVAPLGVAVHTIRGAGFLLDMGSLAVTQGQTDVRDAPRSGR